MSRVSGLKSRLMVHWIKPTLFLQHGDGREEALLDFVHTHPNIANIRGSPSELVAAIDQFGVEKDFLMTVGPAKLEVIKELFSKSRPKIIIELGSYIGWGAAAFGGLLRELHPAAVSGEIKLYTFELNPRFAAVASSFVELAGLKDVVDVIVGPAEESLRRLKAEGKLKRADVVLLDHWEDRYLPDLQTIEELGLLKSGSIVIADNADRAPGYMDYVKDGVATKAELKYKSESIESIMLMGIAVSNFSLDFFLS